MKKTAIITAVSLLVGGVIFTATGLAINGFDFDKIGTAKTETNTYEITEAFENISINVDIADVRFAKSNDGKCTVVCKEKTKAKHSVSAKNGTLTVENNTKLKWYDQIGITTDKIYVTLYLPETAYNALHVETDTGDVEISTPFTYQNVFVESDTGDITWGATVENTLSLSTDTGDVEIRNVTATTVSVESDTGDIELSGVRCENVSVDSDTGDVDCKNLIATEKISVETDTGDVELDACDANSLWIKTSTGDVSGRLLTDKHYIYKTSTGDVKVPQTTGGRCEITTRTGNIHFK